MSVKFSDFLKRKFTFKIENKNNAGLELEKNLRENYNLVNFTYIGLSV